MGSVFGDFKSGGIGRWNEITMQRIDLDARVWLIRWSRGIFDCANDVSVVRYGPMWTKTASRFTQRAI